MQCEKRRCGINGVGVSLEAAAEAAAEAKWVENWLFRDFFNNKNALIVAYLAGGLLSLEARHKAFWLLLRGLL
jgi:hypothetical protein